MAIKKRTIGIRELKSHASEVVQEVLATQAEFVITLRGRPVARIEPLGHPDERPVLDGMGNTRGILAATPPGEWEDFLALKRLWDLPSSDN